jgi:hypothetical protein
MNNHSSGLRLTASGQLGNQNQMGNRWLGTYDNAQGAARHEGDFDDIQASLFFAQQINSFNYWPSSTQTPQAPLSQWFNSSIPGPQQPYICTYNEFDGEGTDEGDLAIAGNTGSSSGGIKWLSERYLYRKLSERPEWIMPGTVFETFHDQKSTTPVGQFYDIEQEMAEMLDVSAAYQQAMDDNYSQLSAKYSDLKATDAQLATATGQDSITLLATRNTLLQDIASLTQGNAALLNNIKSQRASNSIAITAANNAIVTPNVYEQNEKAVNEIYLSVVAEGQANFTTTQINTLTNIASQCPDEGGNAVFKARSMLAVVLENKVYDDDEICNPAQPLIGDNSNSGLQTAIPLSLSVEMYPNPGNGMLTLKWNELEGNGIATMKDMMGRTVLREPIELESGKSVLNLSGISTGIYLCEILIDNKPVFAEKYVLIK